MVCLCCYRAGQAELSSSHSCDNWQCYALSAARSKILGDLIASQHEQRNTSSVSSRKIRFVSFAGIIRSPLPRCEAWNN